MDGWPEKRPSELKKNPNTHNGHNRANLSIQMSDLVGLIVELI